MHSHILIATDGSQLAQKGVEAGLSLAKCFGAKVTAVTVSEPRTHLVPDGNLIPLPETDDGADEVLEQVQGRARELDVPCAAVHVKNQYPAEAILRQAEEHRCDLIVMASHGRRAVGRFLLGGEAVRVITQSSIPVLVCK